MSVLFQALARAERDTLPPGRRGQVAWPVAAAPPRRWISPAELGGGLALMLAGAATGIALAPAPVQIAIAPKGVTQRLAPIPIVPAPAPPATATSELPTLAALPPTVDVPRRPAIVAPTPREAPGPTSTPLPPARSTPGQRSPAPSDAARPAPANPATVSASTWSPRVSLAPGVGRSQAVAVPGTAESGQVLPDGGLEIAATLYRDAGAKEAGRETSTLLPAQLRRYREALLEAEQLMLGQRDSAPLALQAGLLQLRLGEQVRGLDNLRRAAELRPDSPTYKVVLAIGLDYVGARREALAFYQQAQAMITDGSGQHWRSPLPVSLTEMRGRIDNLRRLG